MARVLHSYRDMFFLTFIVALPFIIADVPYIDDLARMAVGYGWNQDGRVFATLVMKSLSLGYPLMDISPIPTLLAVFSLLLSGYIISDAMNIEGRYSKAIIAISMISGPFIVQNLSYQWDSLPMALSMLFVIAPIVFIENRVKYIASTSVALTLSMYLYQATIFAFPSIAAIYIWKSLGVKNRKEITELLITFLLAAIGFVLLYKISTLFISLEFKQSRADLIIFSSQPIENLVKNISGLISVYTPYFSSIVGKAIITAYIFSTITLLISSVRNKILYALTGVLFPPLIVVMTSLVSLLIVNAPIAPRVFPALPLSILMIVIISKKSKLSFIAVSALVAITTVVQLYAYVNALKSEFALQRSIVFQIAAKTDLHNKRIVVNGSAPISNGVVITLKHLPYLKGSIPIYINNGWVWGRQLLENEGVILKEQFLYSPDFDKQRNIAIKGLCDIPVTNQNIHYNVRSNESLVIIDFKKKQCN
ncbi:glucosyltransferase domain-containing protein [Citrobacter koseri]|uniref:glucosyltransferase domain-containing protein n=1 Tax=Citrobacter koseri TaxID=545 RepID=UPI003988C0C0